jgi:predicted DNA-binding transcriptional regulator YafY
MFSMSELVVAPRWPRRQAPSPELLSRSLRRRAKRLAEAVQARRVLHICYSGTWRVVHPHALGRTGRGHLGLLTWQTVGVVRGLGNDGEGWRLFNVARIEKIQFLHATFVPRPRAPGRGWTVGIIAPAAEVPSRDEFLAEVAPVPVAA